MAYFAQELRYGLYDDESSGLSLVLLAGLARKKGGRLVRFVLYRQTMRHAKMIQLNVETAEEAVRRFWPSDAHDMPQAGNEFPNFENEQWERTAPWLDMRGIFYPGTWIKVCIPRHRRRKKKPLQVGNISHVLLKYQAQLPALSRERSRVQLELDAIMSYDEDGDSYVAEDDDKEHQRLIEALDEVDGRIASVVADINRTKEEMRYVVRKMFPKPSGLVPKRVLRYERERKQCLGMFA